MNIVAVIETDFLAGGGFNQALNAIMQMKRICHERFDFRVTTNVIENISYLSNLGIKAQFHKYGLIDRMLLVMKSSWLGSRILARIGLIGSFERRLKKQGADLIYFVMPSSTPGMLQHLNYIFSIWDLCHRDFPEFPEVRGNGVFQDREALYRNLLSPAYLVLTESTSGAKSAAYRYGLDLDRILAMPLSPAPFFEANYSASLGEVGKIYSLESGYYFYPAQLWPHKNHIRILDSLAQLRDQGIRRKLVFVGGDKGAGKYLRERVAELSLDGQVRFLGFIPAEHMRGLYEGCAAVVMPTYFGPTNIPPLEAWLVGRPLIYSSHLAEQVGDAALLVNPDDESSLAEAMKDVLNPYIVQDLVKQGFERLKIIVVQRNVAEQKLLEKLQIFERRRKCWY
jgi:glycosyltransferase involved in cell wall biosynthesis